MKHILPLAIKQFRKDWPFMAARLDSMRDKARAAQAPAAEGPHVWGGAAAGVPEFVTPPE